MAHEDIALALGIARGTLLKHFDQELSTGAAEKRLAILKTRRRRGASATVFGPNFPIRATASALLNPDSLLQICA